MAEGAEERNLPAWSLPAGSADLIKLDFDWPERVTRAWALEGATGKGVRVCILDSGVEPDHPQVGEIGLIADIDRTATITAESDLRCYGMTAWDFRPLVESNAAIAWKMLQVMAQRLKEAQKR